MSAVAESNLNLLRERQAAFAASFHLTLDEFLRIVQTCSMEQITTVLELMKTVEHRSSYRRSCHARVRRWLDHKLPGPPLMQFEFLALVPKWPVKWRLPT